MTNTIDHKLLKEIMHYDPDTGIFMWKVDMSTRALPGYRAGYGGGRYRQILIDKVNYLEHRLAWFYVNGTWPEKELDHINRDKHDNRICNLREVTKSENEANKGALSNNKLQIRGVRKQHGKYTANIQHNKVRNYLGSFDTLEEAEIAYKKAYAELFGDV